MRLLNLAYTSIYVITIIPEAHPLILTATLLAIPRPSLSVVTVAKCSANNTWLDLEWYHLYLGTFTADAIFLLLCFLLCDE